jgi:hypothetical protein
VLSTSVFSSLPITDWTKALLHPCAILGIQPKDVHNFQNSVLVLLDQIWLTRNKLIFEGTPPDPVVVSKHIRITTLHHINAWKLGDSLSAVWTPPPVGSLKANFDVAIRPDFAVAAATLRDHEGNFLAVLTKRLPPMDASLGEAHAALLAASLAVSAGCSSLILEGDSLLTIIAILDPLFFSDWASAPVIADVKNLLLSIPVWKALKSSRCANFCAHLVARWAASHLVFGSIPNSSAFLSSVRIRSGKDPPL